MAVTIEPRASVRVIAYASAKAGTFPTVNIVTTKRPEHREHLQLTAAQAVVQTHKTVMDSGGGKVGLPTVCIQGYTAPN